MIQQDYIYHVLSCKFAGLQKVSIFGKTLIEEIMRFLLYLSE